MKLVCALFLVYGVGALAAATIESNAIPKKVESDIAQIPKSKAGTTDLLHFNVTDKDGVCLLIEGSATFDVTYTLKDNSNGTASFGIPADAVVVAGNCADAASDISVSFFSGYAFNLSFTVADNKTLLSAVSLDYIYDAERFPNASDVGAAVVAQATGLSLALSSATESYRCHASVPVALDDRVNAVVADVRLQAFNVVNAKYGDESVCTEDTVTTVAPTTVAPTTPAPQPATPPVNSFVVVGDNNVTCLRVDAGIRFEILYKVNETVNATAMVDIPANASDYTGECGNNTDTVSVAFLNGWKMELTFSQNTSTKKTAMTAAALTYVVTATRFPDADPSIVNKTINASNDQLEDFTVTLGKSYLCKAEQKVNLTGGVYAHTYSLQYQAFRTDNTSSSFSSAIDCAADQKTSDIVPIAVGAALAALVVIVLVAYLIGRKRSARQGYQTV